MSFLHLKNKSGVYIIKNILNNKFYIGSSVNIYDRAKTHFSKLSKNQHANNYLQNSFNKNGRESFTLELLEECGIELIVTREQYYIDTLKPEFNLRKIAESNIGIPMSEYSKKVLRAVNIKGPVYQYDLEGNFIREWECANDACLGLKYASSLMHANLTLKINRCKDFIFKYEKFDKIEPYVYSRTYPGHKRFYYKKDKNGNILETYESLKECSKALGILRTTISQWIFLGYSFKDKDFIIEYGEKY